MGIKKQHVFNSLNFKLYHFTLSYLIDQAKTTHVQSWAVPCSLSPSRPRPLVTGLEVRSSTERKQRSFQKEALLHLGDLTLSRKSCVLPESVSLKAKKTEVKLAWELPGLQSPGFGHTEQGDAPPRSLVGTDMCPASREHRSKRKEVRAISPWVFDGGEALPMD